MQFILQREILWFIHSTYCHIGIYALIFESFLFDSFHYMAPVQRGTHMFLSLRVIECQQYRVEDQIIYHLFLFKEKTEILSTTLRQCFLYVCLTIHSLENG